MKLREVSHAYIKCVDANKELVSFWHWDGIVVGTVYVIDFDLETKRCTLEWKDKKDRVDNYTGK